MARKTDGISKSQQAIDAILEDLMGRGGIDNVLSEIEQDKPTWKELKSTLKGILVGIYGE